MQLLGRNADLGTHAEHTAVGKAGGCVVVQCGGINVRKKILCGGAVLFFF